MLQFLKFVFATITGLFLFLFLCVVLLIGLASSISSSDKQAEIETNSVLKLELSRNITEQTAEKDPFAEIFNQNAPSQIGLLQIKEAIANAKLDPKIKGIYLSAEDPQAAWATLEEIRESLLDFKTSKKFVYSYAEGQSEKGYYLASLSDKIYINPAGGMELNGIVANYTFFKGLFDKLDIQPEIFRVGKFKSAVEPFFLTKMSDENKMQNKEFLTSISKHYLSKIATSRGIPETELEKIVNELKTETPEQALENKIITNIGYWDQFEDALKSALKTTDKIKMVGITNYLKGEKMIKVNTSANKIAVIIAQGDIVTGDGNEGEIGSETYIKEIAKARKDKKVKAIVLRINSGGGSAAASDMMFREIELAKKEKPVIASMGDYAASGGYYMAMGADSIVAQPTTITGSIGVFGVLFNIEKFFGNKLGITFDHVSTHEYADFPSATRTMNDAEKAKMQNSTNQIYEKFTSLAAKSRKMDVNKLREIAGGRVWSGTDAKRIGLVDVLGNYEDAIKIAAKKAKLKEGDYKVKYSPTSKSPFDKYFKKLNEDAEEKAIAAMLGNDLAPFAKSLKKIKTMEGIQMRMPNIMDIK